MTVKEHEAKLVAMFLGIIVTILLIVLGVWFFSNNPPPSIK